MLQHLYHWINPHGHFSYQDNHDPIGRKVPSHQTPHRGKYYEWEMPYEDRHSNLAYHE